LEATLKELWAVASPQHRTAARKLLALNPEKVVFTMGDLLNKGYSNAVPFRMTAHLELSTLLELAETGRWSGKVLFDRAALCLDEPSRPTVPTCPRCSPGKVFSRLARISLITLKVPGHYMQRGDNGKLAKGVEDYRAA
jgi:hypothetical protein